MRNTLSITLEPELADFVQNQAGTVDPSALINKLFYDDMKRKGVTLNSQSQAKVANDAESRAAEEMLDQQIPSAG